MTDACAASEPFVLQVLGASMEPEFTDGTVIVVEPGGVLQNGSYVVAMHDGDYIFRQLIIESGRWSLRALNDAYPSIEIPGVSAIKGIVIQKAGRRRHERKHYV
ncbi:MAG TPA: S24 family peptidase [Chromatiales bacterium]|nr:S24 family peptidase [Chromatiales bacterium]